MTLPALRVGKGSPLTAADHDANMLFLAGFPSLPSILADTTRGYSFYEPGHVVITLKEGFRYKVAASGASDHHLTTAAGLKLYVLPGDDGVYNFRAFNSTAGASDDFAKLRKALDTLVWGEAPYKRGPAIWFPDPTYRFDQTIELNTVVRFLGNNMGGAGTTFVFPSGTTGIVVNDYYTGNGTAIDPEEAMSSGLSGARGSVFEDIMCRGPMYPSARGGANGLWLRAPATVRSCAFNHFNGSGVLIEAWAPEDKPENPELWGDARGWYLESVSGIYDAKNGLRVRGTRSHSGICTHGNFTYSGWFSIDDHQPGANFYMASHSATSGVGVAGGNDTEPRKSGLVHYEGQRYRADYVLTEDGDPDPAYLEALVETVPGTDPDVWHHVGAGGVHTWFPTWVSDRAPGHYFPGGGYKITGPGASVILSCYAEDDSPGNTYAGGVLPISGIQTNVPVGYHTMGGRGGILRTPGGMILKYGEHTVHLFDEGSNGGAMSLEMGGDKWHLFREEGGTRTIRKEGNANPIFEFLTDTSAETLGTSAPVWDVPCVPVIAIGDRRQTRMTAAPTTGEWAQGDIVWNRDPAAGGNAAWICTIGGSDVSDPVMQWKTCLPIAE